MHSFETFGALCLQLDPESMVMALYESVCEICGDGEVRGPAWTQNPLGSLTCSLG
jgi:hypothetical protein